MTKTVQPASSAPLNIQDSVTKVRDLLKKELGYLTLAQNNKLEAMKVAFDIGEIIEKEVLGPYGTGKLKGFANLCGFEQKTAYNYLSLYRAAWFKGLLAAHADLPRTYWYSLGSSIKWDSDMFGDMIRRLLLQYPIWKKAKSTDTADPDNPDSKHIVDNEKLVAVGHALNDFRDTLEKDGILYAFQEFRLLDCKPPKEQDEFEKWFANLDKNTIYSANTSGTNRELATFIPQTIPSWDNEYVDICYQLSIHKKDKPKYEKALKRFETFKETLTDIVDNDMPYGGLKWKMEKQERLDEIRQKKPIAEAVDLKDKLIRGSCLEMLKTKAFSKKMIDVVLTDPPYGKEVYKKGWDNTTVEHDASAITKEAAELLGKVARLLVNRELISDRFIWFSFVPIDWIHVFLPPVLDAFKGLNIKHHVLVWDKVGLGKGGGFRSFARQADAIIYVNVGDRALAPMTKEGEEKQINMYSSLFRYRAESKDGKNDFWKPPALLEHLIRIATGEDDNEAANRQLILDPFCGAGSTGVAAINCNRDFRLIESHDGQFKKAKDNILDAAGKKTAS